MNPYAGPTTTSSATPSWHENPGVFARALQNIERWGKELHDVEVSLEAKIGEKAANGMGQGRESMSNTIATPVDAKAKTPLPTQATGTSKGKAANSNAKAGPAKNTRTTSKPTVKQIRASKSTDVETPKASKAEAKAPSQNKPRTPAEKNPSIALDDLSPTTPGVGSEPPAPERTGEKSCPVEAIAGSSTGSAANGAHPEVGQRGLDEK
ncbi:hypothetical protein NM208_g17140 [Fusarium decemcellulare]|uniref:Uncharacterized protein n=1 Tax=Fusarium decemcellulare TaxID=57161 RepID=A0ACC1R9E6_9HYPO|nr:hypothetical protein NM208_g17140 [Fusarium decemcellulare]